MESEFKQWLKSRHGLEEVEEIGHGGMGVVYKAKDVSLQRYVAVKRLASQLVQDEESRKRFRSEMVNLGRVHHPAVTRIHYSGVTDQDDAYYVMDYIDGSNLMDHIRARADENVRDNFSIREVAEILLPIASALDRLHSMSPPIIHRDVKPGNILIPAPGNNSYEARSFLTDFGISLTSDETRLTSVSSVIGTEKYLAPEMLGTDVGPTGIHVEATATSDNYALTLVAFEMITLYPFQETMSRDQWFDKRPIPNIPSLGVAPEDERNLAAIQRIFAKALNSAPAYRFSSAMGFIQELARVGNQPAARRNVRPVVPTQRSEPTINFPEIPVQRNGGKPVTGYPGTGKNSRYQQSPAFTGTGSQTVPGKKNKYLWMIWSMVAVLAVVVSGLGIWSAVFKPWTGTDAQLAQAFPNIISKYAGGTGWKDTECSSGEKQSQQTGRIICANSDFSYQVVSFTDEQSRNDQMTTDTTRTVEKIQAGQQCLAIMVTSADEREVAFLPEEMNNTVAIVLVGDQAQELKKTLPWCTP